MYKLKSIPNFKCCANCSYSLGQYDQIICTNDESEANENEVDAAGSICDGWENNGYYSAPTVKKTWKHEVLAPDGKWKDPGLGFLTDGESESEDKQWADQLLNISLSLNKTHGNKYKYRMIEITKIEEVIYEDK